MNRLTTSKRAEIIRFLVEGNSTNQTLRITRAMAAGLTDRLWSLEDIAAL